MAAAIDDTLTAVDYLVEHADELETDPDRLGIVGPSAGGLTSDTVAYGLDDHGVDGPDVSWVGSLWAGIVLQSDRADGNGAVQLDAGEAELFAVHGDADDTLPVILSDQLAARADAEGVPVEYHRIPGGGHGYEGSGFFDHDTGGGQTPFDRLPRVRRGRPHASLITNRRQKSRHFRDGAAGWGGQKARRSADGGGDVVDLGEDRVLEGGLVGDVGVERRRPGGRARRGR